MVEIYNNRKKLLITIGRVAGILAVGVFFGWAITRWSDTVQIYPGIATEKHVASSSGLVSPLLWCDQPENSISSTVIPFEPVVNVAINDLKQKQMVTDVSYYFREMKSGYWLAINEDAIFSPASLLKLPILISLQKESESNPSLWKETQTFTNMPEILPQTYAPSSPPIQKDQTLSFEELAQRMIVESDNVAMDTLQKHVDTNIQNDLFALVGIHLPSSNTDFITVRQYATLFRLLYNASFLNRDSSEKVLKLLSQVEFAGGLRAGVPPEVTIAHKFGEREKGSVKQLHDCGIIYHPTNPYLLCIMTRGDDYKKLESAIGELSKITYLQVSQNTVKPD